MATMEKLERKQNDYNKLLEAECNSLEGRVKLSKNLEIARENVEEVHILNTKIMSLFGEIELTMEEVRSIKMKLNRTAREFGLSSIPIRRVQPASEQLSKQARSYLCKFKPRGIFSPILAIRLLPFCA